MRKSVSFWEDLDSRNIPHVAKQLIVGQPSIYDFFVPDSFKSKYPRLARAAEGATLSPKACGFQRIAKLTSKGGQTFHSFQKHRLFAKGGYSPAITYWVLEGHSLDLYADFVVNRIGKDMYVETWLNGAAKDYLPLCEGPGKVSGMVSSTTNQLSR